MNAAGSARPDVPAEALAEGFAQHIEGWARAHGADPSSVRLARRAAFELSLATGNGHVCLRLADLGATLAADAVEPGEAADLPALRRLLLASGVVGTP
ncbi:MAG: hypothetical protein ACRC2B_24630, partial [Rubrivivax sp.]